jgi:hypothetical protein
MTLLTFAIYSFTKDNRSINILKQILTLHPDINLGIAEQGLVPLIIAAKLSEISMVVIQILGEYTKDEKT